MITKHSERFNGLDHLRALAIVLVLLYHYRAFKHPVWIETLGRFGWTGVDLFFVLSGFLISGQLFKDMRNGVSIDVKTFYIKRFFRIFPPYFFTLFLYFTFPVFREREALPSLWKFVSFTQNYGLDVINQGTFSHAWSLCIEEQFYFILPLILVFMPKKLFKYFVILMILILAFSLTMRMIIWSSSVDGIDNNSLEFWRLWYMKIYYPTHTRLDGLGIGVLIGYLMQYSDRFKKIINHHGNLLLLFGILMLSIAFWICIEQSSEAASTFGFTWVAVSYGIIVLAAVSESSFLSKTKSYITAELAALSYAIYLSHKGVIHIVQDIFEYLGLENSDTISLVVCLLACVVVGLLYRVMIEKPFAALKSKILKVKDKPVLF